MSAGKPECPGNTNEFWNSLADCGRPLHLREILWQTDGDWEKWLHIPHFNRDQCLVQGWKVWRSLSVANFQTRRTVLSAKRRSAFWKKSMRPESTGRKWPEMTGRKRSKETSWTRFTIINAFFCLQNRFLRSPRKSVEFSLKATSIYIGLFVGGPLNFIVLLVTVINLQRRSRKSYLILVLTAADLCLGSELNRKVLYWTAVNQTAVKMSRWIVQSKYVDNVFFKSCARLPN